MALIKEEKLSQKEQLFFLEESLQIELKNLNDQEKLVSALFEKISALKKSIFRKKMSALKRSIGKFEAALNNSSEANV